MISQSRKIKGSVSLRSTDPGRVLQNTCIETPSYSIRPSSTTLPKVIERTRRPSDTRKTGLGWRAPVKKANATPVQGALVRVGARFRPKGSKIALDIVGAVSAGLDAKPMGTIPKDGDNRIAMP